MCGWECRVCVDGSVGVCGEVSVGMECKVCVERGVV